MTSKIPRKVRFALPDYISPHNSDEEPKPALLSSGIDMSVPRIPDKMSSRRNHPLGKTYTKGALRSTYVNDKVKRAMLLKSNRTLLTCTLNGAQNANNSPKWNQEKAEQVKKSTATTYTLNYNTNRNISIPSVGHAVNERFTSNAIFESDSDSSDSGINDILVSRYLPQKPKTAKKPNLSLPELKRKPIKSYSPEILAPRNIGDYKLNLNGLKCKIFCDTEVESQGNVQFPINSPKLPPIKTDSDVTRTHTTLKGHVSHLSRRNSIDSFESGYKSDYSGAGSDSNSSGLSDSSGGNENKSEKLEDLQRNIIKLNISNDESDDPETAVVKDIVEIKCVTSQSQDEEQGDYSTSASKEMLLSREIFHQLVDNYFTGEENLSYLTHFLEKLDSEIESTLRKDRTLDGKTNTNLKSIQSKFESIAKKISYKLKPSFNITSSDEAGDTLNNTSIISPRRNPAKENFPPKKACRVPSLT